MEAVQQKWICGFWRRVAALVIDTLVLGGFGLILGVFLSDVFVQLGGWGRAIGFIVSIVYFGTMNSSLAEGQTLGKKWLDIRVVDRNNSTISPAKSFLRYSFLAIPFSLNGAHITNEALLSYLMYPLSMIIFGGLLSITYLYVFNQRTRQSLHDLVVGTYVVNCDTDPQPVENVWKPHLAVVASLFIIAAVIPVFTANLAQSKPFEGLLKTQAAINDHARVNYAGVTDGSTTFTSSGEASKTTTYISVEAYLYSDKTADNQLAMQLVEIVLDNYPEALKRDVVQVTLTYGYDIGIASSWTRYNHVFRPDEIAQADSL